MSFCGFLNNLRKEYAHNTRRPCPGFILSEKYDPIEPLLPIQVPPVVSVPSVSPPVLLPAPLSAPLSAPFSALVAPVPSPPPGRGGADREADREADRGADRGATTGGGEFKTVQKRERNIRSCKYTNCRFVRRSSIGGVVTYKNTNNKMCTFLHPGETVAGYKTRVSSVSSTHQL